MAGRFKVESMFTAVDRFTRPVRRMQQSMRGFTSSAALGLRNVNRMISRTGRGLKDFGGAVFKYGTVAVGALAGSIALLVREFSKIEDAEAAFTPLLGGAERAKQLVDALNTTAATTPFQFENLADATKQLLPVMNGDIEKTIKTIRMLGDTAGGNAQKLDSITRGFTKAMLKGKVDMESLNMIAEAGVPIFTELADSMGKKVNKSFFKMISAGRVTTKDLIKAFEKMTSEGGKFFNGMEIASRTTSGMWSTLKDNVALTAAAIGEILAPTIKDLIKQATGGAQSIREWVKANRELVTTKFLEYVDLAKKFVLALVGAFNWLREHGETVLKVAAWIASLVVALKVLGAVMMVVNLIMMANPAGLIALAITALIVAVSAAIIWWDELKAAFLSLPDPVIAAIALLTGPIGWLIGSAALIYKNWEPIKAFFKGLWDGVVEIFNSAVEKVLALVDRVKKAAAIIVETISRIGGGVAEFFGFGGDEEEDSQRIAKRAAVVSPQERTARMIEESRTTAEVTIRDETNRAEVTRGKLGPGVLLSPSGAF